jgi:hypothetical protein
LGCAFFLYSSGGGVVKALLFSFANEPFRRLIDRVVLLFLSRWLACFPEGGLWFLFFRRAQYLISLSCLGEGKSSYMVSKEL